MWPVVVAVIAAAPSVAEAWEAADLSCEAAPVIGRVVKVKDGKLVINVGSLHGMEVGARVGVIPCSALPHHEKLGHGVVCEDNPDVTAVVLIDVVEESWSSGVIGRGSSAMKGDIVFLSDRAPTDKKGFPGFPGVEAIELTDPGQARRVAEATGLAIAHDEVLVKSCLP